MSLSQLVPYAVLTKISNNGSFPNITISNSKRGVMGKGPISWYGLNSVEIKHKGSFVEVSAEIYVSQDLIENGDNDTSFINRLFSFNEKFKIEFGWAGDGGEGGNFGAVLSDLMLSNRPSLKWDSATRTFDVSLQLVSANALVLDEIKIGSIRSYLNMGIDQTNNVNDSDYYVGTDSTGDANTDRVNGPMYVPSGIPGAPGTPLSLADIISDLLNASRSFLNNAKSYIMDPIMSYQREVIESRRNEVVALLNKGAYAEDGMPLQNMTFVASRMLFLEESDIPQPADIRLVCFDVELNGGAKTDGTSIATDFSTTPIKNKDSLNRIFNDNEYANTSVLQVIDNILFENGFTIWQTPEVIDKHGKMKWTILQTRFNNIDNFNSYEYNSILDTSSPIDAANGSFKTILDKNSNFDVHSNNNIILSIDASIDPGEPTIYSSIAADRYAGKGNEYTYGSVSAIENNIISMYESICQEQRELNMVILGLPAVILFDNIQVFFCGRLFSGIYKILEITHVINDDGFETAFRMIQTKSGIPTDLTGNSESPSQETDSSEVVPKVDFMKKYQDLPGVRPPFGGAK